MFSRADTVGGPGVPTSSVFQFKTSPYLDAASGDYLNIAVIGDMGSTNQSDATVARLATRAATGAIDVVLHNGDIAYSDGFDLLWDEFARKTTYTSRVPVMTTPGNHELFFDFNTYRQRLFMPGPFAKTSLFWSLDIDLVHVVGLNSESEYDLPEMDASQVQWLANDLKAVDRTKTPWVVVMLHRPLYCSGGGTFCGADAALLRQALEQLFNQRAVDIVIQAHLHVYESFWPTDAQGQPTQKNYVRPTAPVYIVNGAAGCREGLAEFHGALPSSKARLRDYGFAELQVRNATWLRWQYVDDQTGSLLDEIVITK